MRDIVLDFDFVHFPFSVIENFIVLLLGKSTHYVNFYFYKRKSAQLGLGLDKYVVVVKIPYFADLY